MQKLSRVADEVSAAVAALSQADRALDEPKVKLRLEPHRTSRPDLTTYNTVAYGSLAFGLLCWLLAGMAGAPGWVWAFIVATIGLGLVMLVVKGAAIWLNGRRGR